MLPLLFIAAALGAEPAHGDTTAGVPSAEGHHPEGAEAHPGFTDDTDHDGVPNWRDRLNGAEDNPEYVVMPIFWHAVNLGILVVIGVVALRRPLGDTFRERALAIRHELTDSARRRDEAHQRHQELIARLDRIEGEVATMQAAAEADAKREEEKLVERARREAARISEQAERNIRDETTRARTELRREAVELAVQLAEATLRQGVGPQDRQALARDFLTSIRGGGGHV